MRHTSFQLKCQNKTNLAASGVSEEYGELKKVLDIIIEEVDVRRNEQKLKKDAENRKASDLKEAAKSLRNMATKRANITGDDRDDVGKPKNKTSKLCGGEVLGGMEDDVLHLIDQDKMGNEN